MTSRTVHFLCYSLNVKSKSTSDVCQCVSMILFYLSVGGTAGAIVTCPLEVVKTRLQSSNSGFGTTLKVGAVEAVRVDSVEAVNHLTSAAKTGGKVSHVVYR